MSHYIVAVFSNSPDEDSFHRLLAPYGEDNEEYFSFVPLDDSGIEFLRGIYNKVPRDIDFQDWILDDGYEYDEHTGQIGYQGNPNGKWDWYSLDGGEWAFHLRKGADMEDDTHRKNDYRYGKEDYPYAFITPDGVWHAPGRVGWFAMSDDTPESTKEYLKEWRKFIASDENPFVNFVDVHI